MRGSFWNAPPSPVETPETGMREASRRISTLECTDLCGCRGWWLGPSGE